MSFHNTLTRIESDNTYHTTASFMNGKFNELLDNTVANKEAIENITASDVGAVPVLNNLIAVTGMNLDTDIPKGWSHGFNCTGTLPNGYTNDNDFMIKATWENDLWKQIEIADVRSDKRFTRRLHDGVWQEWQEVVIGNRGYINTIRSVGADYTEELLNTLVYNGKYTLVLTGVTGIPNGWYNMDVTMHSDTNYTTQVLKRMAGWSEDGEVYIRTKSNNEGWTVKHLVAQTTFQLTSSIMQNGWQLCGETAYQDITQMGDRLFCRLRLEKGTITSGTVICRTPFRPATDVHFITMDASNNAGKIYIKTNGDLTVWNLSSNNDVIVP